MRADQQTPICSWSRLLRCDWPVQTLEEERAAIIKVKPEVPFHPHSGMAVAASCCGTEAAQSGIQIENLLLHGNRKTMRNLMAASGWQAALRGLQR